MGEFWYLWRVEASADFMPVSIGCLRTTADQVEVVSLEDEAVLAELAYLKEAEALKLRWSERESKWWSGCRARFLPALMRKSI